VTLGRQRVRLGDRVEVRLVEVDPARGRFRLALTSYAEASGSSRPARRSHSG
jgi:ribosomal protein S1